MKNLKKFVSVALAGILCVAVAVCGKASYLSVDDQAANRVGEVSDIHYYDDEAIALAGSASSSAAHDICMSVVGLMNQERTARGLSELAWNNGLEGAANVRASEASVRWSHTRPDGSAWWTVNSDLQYGENLAKGYSTADAVYAAWMASPSHAANIMDASFNTVGMAIYQEGDYWYWAQEFGY